MMKYITLCMVVLSVSVEGFASLRNSPARQNRLFASDITSVESEVAKIFENKEINERRTTNDDTTLPRLDGLIDELEAFSKSDATKTPFVESPLIDGCWKLLYTSNKRGENSPIQRTVTASDAVSIYQVVNLLNTSSSFLKQEENAEGPLPDVSNVVCFGDKARLRVTALASTFNRPFVVPRRGDGRIFGMNIFGVSATDSAESARVDTTADRIDFAFQEARFEVANFPQFTVPYPVPFKLLGDESKGWLDTTYLSDRFTIKRGNKGTLFLLERVLDLQADKTAQWAAAPIPIRAATSRTPSMSIPSISMFIDSKEKSVFTSSSSGSSSTEESPTSTLGGVDDLTSEPDVATLPSTDSAYSRRSTVDIGGKRRVAIIFPAQLSTDEDYEELSAAIRSATSGRYASYPAPLARFNWPIGLIPSFFSPKYFAGALQPEETLAFYFKKVDRAVEKALLENSEADLEFVLVGHSIGGWVARAWLSGWASPAVKARVRALVTLGSPHNPPPEGSIFEKFDQTRGLLSYINRNYPGACEPGVRYASVIGGQIQGGFPALDPEKTLAFASYLALAGKGRASGDGIIPILTSQLQGAELLTIEGDCRHSNFVPTLGKSVKLPVQWYGSEGVIDQWVTFLS